jgi:hypothetical protein
MPYIIQAGREAGVLFASPGVRWRSTGAKSVLNARRPEEMGRRRMELLYRSIVV